MRYPKVFVALMMVVAGANPASAQSGQYGDPPSRVGRVSDLSGAVSLYLAGATDWTDAAVNYPVTSGDAVYSDDGARAEIHVGTAAIRIGARTSIVFGEVSDSVTQVRIDQGTIEIFVHAFQPGDVYEVDTPNGIVMLADAGRYRIDVTPDGRRATVTTRVGVATVEAGTSSRTIGAGSSATLLSAQRFPVVGEPVAVDGWEDWANARDQRDFSSQGTQFVSADVLGAEDLDDYGAWQRDPTYGAIWFPRDVPTGWAPYRFGRWESIAPWGWTWIDDAPWGFAPFHYGRWAYLRGRWGWTPGPRNSRPIYAPALVAFIGGPGWSASASFGGRPAVGWVPLAPGEPYIPGYRTTSGYVDRINAGNGRNTVQPNPIDIRYVNRDVPGAVTAVSRDDFTRSRPIGSTAVAVRPGEVLNGRPSTIPLAGDERLIPPARRDVPVNNDRGGRGSRPNQPPPPVPARPRPTDTARNDPRARPVQGTPPPAMPPVNQPPIGRGQPPVTPTPPPVVPPPQAPPPQRGGRPADTTRNDPRGRPVTPTPPATPPGPPPSTPPVPADPVRGRPVPQQQDRSAEYQQKLNQLIAKQQKEDADLAKRHAALMQNRPAAIPAEQIQKQIDAENKQFAVRHQQERDALAKQYVKPAG